MYRAIVMEREEICKMLEAEFSGECVFCRAENIRELLNRQKTEAADVLLVDLDLPECRMQETVTHLQHHSRNSAVLFLAELSVFDASHPMTVISAVDYIIKPCSRNDLVMAIDAALHSCEQKNRAKENESLRISLVRERIQRYIQEHYAEDLSMQSVAQAMNYSETHFCRLFKQCFKVNFSAYLNEFRIEKAKECLRDTNHTVKEIGLLCGYQDNSYFIRVFKRFTDLTPMDYRIVAQTMSRK